MQYAPTIFTTDYRSHVKMLTIICLDTYGLRAGKRLKEKGEKLSLTFVATNLKRDTSLIVDF